MTRIGLFLIIAALLVTAVPARAAKLVYVKGGSVAGTMYAANADGSARKKLRRGAYPAISPDGKTVGYVSTDFDELQLVSVRGGEILQTAIDDKGLRAPRFSPNSKLIGVTSNRRLYIDNIRTGAVVRSAPGAIQGWSFSPDSKWVVYAKAARGATYPARSDLYVLNPSTGHSTRLTTGQALLNPLWTARGIVYDQLADASVGGFPHFTLQRRNIEHADVENVVDNGPTPDDLTSGLVPIAASKDGNRVLASFEGQSRHDPYGVENLSAHLLAQGALIPTDISRDGSTVLAHTGSGDPSDPANVVTITFAGGTPEVIVTGASWAHWNR